MSEDYKIQSSKPSRFCSQCVKQPGLRPWNKMPIPEGHCLPDNDIKE